MNTYASASRCHSTRPGRVSALLACLLIAVPCCPAPPARPPTLHWDVGALPAKSGPQSIRVTLRVAATATGGTTLTTNAAIASDTAELEQANNTSAGPVYVGSVLFLPVMMR